VGVVPVVVTNPNGQSATLADSFTYVAPPTLTSVTPNTLGLLGGQIGMSGTGLWDGKDAPEPKPFLATVGGSPVGALVGSGMAGQLFIPPQAAGTYDVTVTNPDGQSSTLTNALTFLAPTRLEKVDATGGGIWQVDYALSGGGTYRHYARIVQDALGTLSGETLDTGTSDKYIVTTGETTGADIVVGFEISYNGVPQGFVTCTGTIYKAFGQPQEIRGTFTATDLAAVGSLGGTATDTCVLR
jgi:hypothetical protein